LNIRQAIFSPSWRTRSGYTIAASVNGTPTWTAALVAFEGVDQFPLMTVHKSKGLEYDTIVFVGLDDQAWWAHRPGNPEGLATFFVALSRAKQRAILAFYRERGQRQRVAEFFEFLTDAGVPEIAYESARGPRLEPDELYFGVKVAKEHALRPFSNGLLRLS